MTSERVLRSFVLFLMLTVTSSCSASVQAINLYSSHSDYLQVSARTGNVLLSSDLNTANSVYVIDKDYTIPRGEVVKIADNVTLFFDGGSITGEGALVFKHTVLCGQPKIHVNVSGTVSDYACPEWFKSENRSWDDIFAALCSFQCEVRLRSNTIYKLTKPLYTGYSCMMRGGTNSTLHFDKCSTCIYVGHSNKLQDFNVVITNPGKVPVALEINTEHLGNTMINRSGTQLPFSFWWGSLLNIYIERLNIDFNGDASAYNGYGIKMLANKMGQNGWNIKVSDCVICGYFEYAFYVMSDDSMTAEPTTQTAWFTDVYFYNNRIARAKNGFYFGRRDSPGCLAPEKILISGCSMQGGDEEKHPYFVNADCVNNLAIRDCMAWDWTANNGKAYRFTTECKAVDVWDADNLGYIFDGKKSEADAKIVFKSNNKKLLKRGDSKSRPDATLYNDGDVFFDTTLKKPLWKYGDKWYDANGKEY